MGKVTLLQSSLLDELKRILQKDSPKSLHVSVKIIVVAVRRTTVVVWRFCSAAKCEGSDILQKHLQLVSM